MMARQTAAARYDQQNELCARLVLGDVDRYGGDGAGLVVWARVFLERVERERVAQIGPLFPRRAA